MLDGLGWEQLQEHRDLLPTLTAMEGGPITTVAPTTTATALSSIATGLTPAEHGLLGYRMLLGGEVINVLRWTSTIGDRRRAHPPHDVQPFAAFLGHQVPVISPAELQGTAFTEGHLRGSRPVGYRATSAIAVEVGRQLRRRRALRLRLLRPRRQDGPRARLRRVLRRRAAHRRPPRRRRPRRPHAGRRAARDRRSRPGRRRRPDRRSRPATSSISSPCSRARAASAGGTPATAPPTSWPRRPPSATRTSPGSSRASRSSTSTGSGPPSPRRSPPASATWRSCPFAPISFFDPADSGPFELICRHGSLTPAEVLVPLLAGRR